MVWRGCVAAGSLWAICGGHFVGFIRELEGDPDTDLVLAILVRQQAAHLHQGLQGIEGARPGLKYIIDDFVN